MVTRGSKIPRLPLSLTLDGRISDRPGSGHPRTTHKQLRLSKKRVLERITNQHDIGAGATALEAIVQFGDVGNRLLNPRATMPAKETAKHFLEKLAEAEPVKSGPGDSVGPEFRNHWHAGGQGPPGTRGKRAGAYSEPTSQQQAHQGQQRGPGHQGARAIAIDVAKAQVRVDFCSMMVASPLQSRDRS